MKLANIPIFMWESYTDDDGEFKRLSILFFSVTFFNGKFLVVFFGGPALSIGVGIRGPAVGMESLTGDAMNIGVEALLVIAAILCLGRLTWWSTLLAFTLLWAGGLLYEEEDDDLRASTSEHPE